MRAPTKAANLGTRVESLLQQRQQHMDAVSRIDATLGEIEKLLGLTVNGRRRGRPPGRPRADAGAAAAPAGAPRGRRRGRRKRGSFETTGEESIINFIKSNKNPTTQEVKAHWASEGRGGTADNALSKLVREKKIKRIPLEGERGSRYAV